MVPIMKHVRMLAAASLAVLAGSAWPAFSQSAIIGQQCVPAVANPDMYTNCHRRVVRGETVCRCAVLPRSLGNRAERLDEGRLGGALLGAVPQARAFGTAPAAGTSAFVERGRAPDAAAGAAGTRGAALGAVPSDRTSVSANQPLGAAPPNGLPQPAEANRPSQAPQPADVGKPADTPRSGQAPGRGGNDQAGNAQGGKNNNGLGNGWDPGDRSGGTSFAANDPATDLSKGSDPSNPAHGSGSDGPGKSEGSKAGGDGKGGGKK